MKYKFADDTFDIEIEGKNVPFVLVKFTNRSDGAVNRARFDLGKRTFIDQTPTTPNSRLKDTIVDMYNIIPNNSVSNEGIWLVSVCKIPEGWQTPILFRESQREKMDKFILEEQLKRNTVSTTHIYGMAVEPLREFFLKGN